MIFQICKSWRSCVLIGEIFMSMFFFIPVMI
uniref:Uncharacterized protein n=1 Tax=Rhizophora mucronata TaxID=61149 RepID=A0A2P2PB04_RHIMU